ncbi:class I SAM-dependent methyltransferase [Pseudofulvibacter geojedonensis]|uniref:Class I SAM-dependent methyltransferase n=1 Tax=Pseudofulvibacter geojedonensis TaxID=1123758 RepID=A0ABW3I0F9_9FLAO
MNFLFSTEVTSSKIKSDNALYQRTFKAYEIVSTLINGNVLEIGCGEGYAIELLKQKATSLTLVDKSKSSLQKIKKTHPNLTIYQSRIPPLIQIKDNTFDSVISFQVIEHIKDYNSYLKEIKRVLKPGGKAYLTTPNKIHTIARNPWHYKEFSKDELETITKKHFNQISILGIEGSIKTEQYYFNNKKNVSKILKLDVFNIHKILPRWCLILPYEFFNRLNRKKLYKTNENLVNIISSQDYSLADYSTKSLDLFCVLQK